MAYKAYTQAGIISPDTLTIGYTRGCGGQFYPLWKKGGSQLATAGTQTAKYTPAAADWSSFQFDLDSLLNYPEIAIGFENYFGYGNRLFIDDIRIDTIDNCPSAPMVMVNTDSICVGNALVLSMDSLSGATYAWTGPGNFTSSSRIASRTITVVNQGGPYKGIITKDNCSSPATTQQIAAFAKPTIPTITVAGNLLTGPANMVNYIWILNGTDTLAAHTRSITAPTTGSYVLVVFNAGGCFNTSLPKTVTVTSTEKFLTKSEWKAVPNPTEGKLWIETNDASARIIGLYNGMGQNVGSQVNTTTEKSGIRLDLKNLPVGCYWIKISSSKGISSLPILKK